MPVLVHGLFVASLCLPALAAGGEAATAGPGLRRGTYCNEPALSPPSLLPLPLCPPPPSSTSSLCSRCSATSRHPQRGSVAVSRQPQEPIVWNVERNPRAHVDGSLNVVMADELCPCPPNIIDAPIRRYHLARDDGHRGGFTSRLGANLANDERLAGLRGTGLLAQLLEHPGTLHPLRSPRCELAVGSAPEPSTTLT